MFSGDWSQLTHRHHTPASPSTASKLGCACKACSTTLCPDFASPESKSPVKIPGKSVYVTALYVTSWLLSGTWLSGLLAALWYVTNSLTWQFNQFMMLLQALVLFILDSLDMLPAVK
ncbi:hypothetical protein A6R68_16555, partial [Neotoma lepida]